MILLLIIFLIVIFAGIIEYRLHKINLNKIPCIIHVNGIRGKSSTTRLIHGALNASGFKTIAKTTGTEPRLIFSDGQEEVIYRTGIPRIIEQARIINQIKNKNIDVLVLECMAISPEMQWISEEKLLNAEIGVITNVKLDHEDKMGDSLEKIASTLSLTIPKEGDLITAENNFFNKFKKVATKRNTEIHYANDFNINLVKHFDYPVFAENINCTLQISKLFNIDKSTALSGMKKTKPDPGALMLYKIKLNNYSVFLINSFAANDYESTLKTWHKWKDWYDYKQYKSLPLIGIFNNRMDRSYRFKDFKRILQEIEFSDIFVTGYSPIYLLSKFSKKKSQFKKLDNSIKKELNSLSQKYNSDILIFGFGNTKDQGLKIINYFRDNGEIIQ